MKGREIRPPPPTPLAKTSHTSFTCSWVRFAKALSTIRNRVNGPGPEIARCTNEPVNKSMALVSCPLSPSGPLMFSCFTLCQNVKKRKQKVKFVIKEIDYRLDYQPLFRGTKTGFERAAEIEPKIDQIASYSFIQSIIHPSVSMPSH